MYDIVFSVLPIVTVDHGEDVDSMGVADVSEVTDSLVD